MEPNQFTVPVSFGEGIFTPLTDPPAPTEPGLMTPIYKRGENYYYKTNEGEFQVAIGKGEMLAQGKGILLRSDPVSGLVFVEVAQSPVSVGSLTMEAQYFLPESLPFPVANLTETTDFLMLNRGGAGNKPVQRISVAALLAIVSGRLIPSAVPAHARALGRTGNYAMKDNYFYLNVEEAAGTNKWIRWEIEQEFTVTDAPQTVPAPTSLTAVNVATTHTGNINLAWVYNQTASGFEIYQSIGDDQHFTRVGTSADGNLRAFQVTQALPDRQYFFQVVAMQSGRVSGPSNTANVTTPAIAASARWADVTGITMVPFASQNKARILFNTSDAGGFARLDFNTNVNAQADSETQNWRPINQPAVASVGGQSIDIDGITSAAPFIVRILRWGLDGKNPSNWVKAGPFSLTPSGVVVNAPSNLVASVQTNGNVGLTWVDNSNNETLFGIFRAVNGGGFVSLAGPGENVTTYTDATTTAGNTYAYQVRAIRNSGNELIQSAFSNTATATIATAVVIAAPKILTVEHVGGYLVRFAVMVNNLPSGASIQLEVSNSSSFASIAKTQALTPAYSFGDQVATIDLPMTAFAGSTMHVRAKVVTASGQSSAWLVVSKQLFEAIDQLTVVLGGSRTGNKVRVNWNVEGDLSNNNGYVVEQSINQGSWTGLGTVLRNTGFYEIDTNPAAFTAFRVRHKYNTTPQTWNYSQTVAFDAVTPQLDARAYPVGGQRIDPLPNSPEVQSAAGPFMNLQIREENGKILVTDAQWDNYEPGLIRYPEGNTGDYTNIGTWRENRDPSWTWLGKKYYQINNEPKYYTTPLKDVDLTAFRGQSVLIRKFIARNAADVTEETPFTIANSKVSGPDRYYHVNFKQQVIDLS